LPSTKKIPESGGGREPDIKKRTLSIERYNIGERRGNLPIVNAQEGKEGLLSK